MPIVVYYRIKSLSGEKLDRRQEGLFILLTLRPLGIACMVGLIVYMIDPGVMAWSSLPLPVWLRWLGIGLGASAGLLLTWTLRTLGRNLTDTVVTRREHTLVSGGPYRWIRHPFYSSIFLMVVANALATANWFLFLAGVLFIGLMVLRTRTEEQFLLQRFGEEYQEYAARKGRFFPKILS